MNLNDKRMHHLHRCCNKRGRKSYFVYSYHDSVYTVMDEYGNAQKFSYIEFNDQYVEDNIILLKDDPQINYIVASVKLGNTHCTITLDDTIIIDPKFIKKFVNRLCKKTKYKEEYVEVKFIYAYKIWFSLLCKNKYYEKKEK